MSSAYKSSFKDYIEGQKEKLEDFTSIQQFQNYFDILAKEVLSNYAIAISDKIKYYLIEIEFYYNNEDMVKMFTDEEMKKFFTCTYKRKRVAGQLFWHYSGVDICCQTSHDEH